MQRRRGFTLLETILALSVGAIIVVLSLRQYRQYQIQINQTAVPHNVTLLMNGLNAFYHRAACTYDGALTPRQGGIFPTLNTNLINTLSTQGYLQSDDLRVVPYFNQTDTIAVKGMIASVYDTGITVAFDSNAYVKHVYGLEVLGVVAANMTDEQWQYLAHLWHANAVVTSDHGILPDDTRVFEWRQFPGHRSVLVSNHYAALAASSNQFIREEDEKVGVGDTAATQACLN